MQGTIQESPPIWSARLEMRCDPAASVFRLPARMQIRQRGEEKLIAVDATGFSENVEIQEELLCCFDKLSASPHAYNLYKFCSDCQGLLLGC